MGASGLAARAQQALDLAAGQQVGAPAREVQARLHDAYLEARDQPPLRTRLASALGRSWSTAREPERGAAFADEAVRLAEDADNRLLLADALDARLATRSGPDHLVVRLGTSLRLLEVARQVADPGVRANAHVWRLTTGLEHLDLSAVRRQLAALELLADETQDPRMRFLASSRRAMFALTEGDVVGATALTEEAAACGRSGELPDYARVVHELRAEVARQRGDRVALASRAASLTSYASTHDEPGLLASATVLWLECGDHDRSGHLVEELSPRVTDLPREADWTVTVSKLCEASAGVGRDEVAAVCADLLAPYAGRAVLSRRAAVFCGVVEDYLALASGDAHQSEQARLAYERIGADWWARRGPRRRGTGSPDGSGPRILHLHPTRSDVPAPTWCVGREGSLRLMPSAPGLHHLRLLLRSPGTDVPITELAEVGTDRARATVRGAIATALVRLEQHAPEVAHELRTTIRTGAACRYQPDPFRPVEWQLEGSGPVESQGRHPSAAAPTIPPWRR